MWTKLICMLQGHRTGEVYFVSPSRFKAKCKCGKRDVTQALPYFGEDLPEEVKALQESLARVAKQWEGLLGPEYIAAENAMAKWEKSAIRDMVEELERKILDAGIQHSKSG